MKGKRIKQELKHVIIGMDRMESIYKRLGLHESIVIIINSTIINNDINRKIEIEIDEIKKEFIMRIRGRSLPKVISFEKEVNINENLLLMAMAYLCKHIRIVTTQDNIIKTKELHFKDINENLFSEKLEEDIEEKNLENGIEFIIKESDFTIHGREVLNIKNRKILTNTLQNAYRNRISRGLEIKLFGEKIKCKDIDGNLLNKKENSYNSSEKIDLYKMKNESKGVEVIVNGVKIENKNFDEIINWDRKPFKQNGYTFKRLFISIILNKENLNLNNYNLINEYIKRLRSKINEEVERYKEDFKNEYVNISLEYNRGYMNEIVFSTKQNNVNDATKVVLDQYFSKIDDHEGKIK